MFRLLLKDVATKKMLVNFRELTSYLMKEAGMDEELPELVDKMATIKMIAGMFLFIIVMRTGILSRPLEFMVNKVAGEGNVIFLLLPFVSLYLFLAFFFLLYRIWSKKVLTRKLGELIPLAERAIAKLKAAGRDDLEEDIEDAEFLIEDYKKRFGFEEEKRMKFSFQNRITNQQLEQFRYLTDILTQEARVTQAKPKRAEQKLSTLGFITGFLGYFFIKTEIFKAPTMALVDRVAQKPGFVSISLLVLFFAVPLFFLWCLLLFLKQKFYEKEISGLIVLAKKSMAILKETNRIDMDDDIEDAEFLIEDYKKRFGL